MKNWIRIVVIVLMIIGATATYIVYAQKKEAQHLEQDTQHLYEIAEGLGYSEGLYLNFHRSYATGIDANYDVLGLLFTTEQSLEEFSRLVRKLGFQERSSFSFEDRFPNGGDELTQDLFLRGKANIIFWELFDESEQILVLIRYATPNGEEKNWRYRGTEVSGSIVQIDLDRLN